MKTSGYVMQGLPNPDGHVFIPIKPGDCTSGTASTWTKLSSGVFATVQGSGIIATYDIPVHDLIFRYGMQDDSQIIGGRANGQPGALALPLTNGNVFQSPYSNTPRPPVPSKNIFVQTGPIAKGVQLNAVSLVYQVLGAAIAQPTLGITSTQFVSTLAPAVTNILPQGAYGLPIAVAAQPVISTINLPNPAMTITRFTELVAELYIATPGGASVNLFGLFFDVSFNYN